MKKIIAICVILLMAMPMVLADGNKRERANNVLEHSMMVGDDEGMKDVMEKQGMNMRGEKANMTQEERKQAREDKFDKKFEKYEEWKQKRIDKIEKLLEEKELKLTDEDSLKKLALMGGGLRKQLERLQGDELQKKLAMYKLMKFDETKGFKQRVLEDAEKEEHKNKAKKLMDKGKENKEQTEKDREEFKKLKTTIDKCENKDACPEAFEAARKVLLDQLARIVNYDEKLKAKIQANEYMDATTVKEKVAEIDKQITEINQIAEKVKVATTVKDLENLRRNMIEAFNKIKYQMHNNAIGVIANKYNGLLKRVEHMEVRLDATLDSHPELADKYKADIEKFNSLIEDAKKNLQDSKDLSAKAIQDKENKDLLKDARKALMQALADIKEAHQIVVEITKELNDKGIEIQNVDEVLVEQEA